LFFIAVLVIFLLLFFGAIKFSEHYENKQQMSLLSLRNKMLEESMEETEKTFFLWKASLHDYKHNIFHLMTLADNSNLDEIKRYLKKENELLTQKLFYYKTGNKTVDTIVNVKQAIAHEGGITFLINASVPEKSRINDTHLCAILGNLIDNAMNASKNEHEPYIEVSIKQVKDFLIIKVVNKFTEITQKSTKPKEAQLFHGIGLKSVKRIVKDYNGGFTTVIEDGLFIAEVMISL
jgi:sensor histidine kinase regulating citrate/malate metabolism